MLKGFFIAVNSSLTVEILTNGIKATYPGDVSVNTLLTNFSLESVPNIALFDKSITNPILLVDFNTSTPTYSLSGIIGGKLFRFDLKRQSDKISAIKVTYDGDVNIADMLDGLPDVKALAEQITLPLTSPSFEMRELDTATPNYEASGKLNFGINDGKDNFLDFIKDDLQINDLKLTIIKDLSKGKASITGSLGTNIELFKEGDFSAILTGANLTLGLEKGEPIVGIGAGLTLKGYDPLQDGEPDLKLSGGLTLDPTSLTGKFQLDPIGSWKNPFGLSNTELRNIAFQLGGTYVTPYVSKLGFIGDLKFGNSDLKSAFLVDTKKPQNNALELTANQPVRLVDLWIGPVGSYVLKQGAKQTTIVKDALEFLNKIVDVSIESVDGRDLDTELDPLIKFVPVDTKIGDTTLKQGIGINGRLTAWGKPATLNIDTNPYASIPSVTGSLSISEINLGFLQISGANDKTLDLAFKVDGKEQYLKGDGKLKIFGQDFAKVDFAFTKDNLNIRDLDFNFLGFGIDIDNLNIDFKNYSGSGVGKLKIFGQEIANAGFEFNQDALTVSGGLGFSIFGYSVGVGIKIKQELKQNLSTTIELTAKATGLFNDQTLTLKIDELSKITSLYDWVADLVSDAVLGAVNQAIEDASKAFNTVTSAVVGTFNSVGKFFVDTFKSVTNWLGLTTDNDDKWLDDNNNFYDAKAGNDYIRGKGGNDWLVGGGDDDTLEGWSGNDRLEGNTGSDKLYGDEGDDLLEGGDGVDLLYGRDDNDWLKGGNEPDSILGIYITGDKLYGDKGNDKLEGEEGNDLLEGGEGNDLLDGGKNNDTLLGGTGSDVLDGGEGDDSLKGGEDNDRLYGFRGNDSLDGENGNDELHGYYGNDTLSGGTGNDILFGQKDQDILYGGDGDDTLYGEDNGKQGQTYDGINNNDTLDGGNGNDFLFGGIGDDKLYGNTGKDYLDGGDGNDELHGFQGQDMLIGGRGEDILYGQQDNDVIRGGDGNDYLYGEDNRNQGQTYSSTSNNNDILDGEAGNDTLDGGIGNDTLDGGIGNDWLVGGDGNDTLNGGDGNDALNGGDGNDTLNGGDGNDTLNGGNGNDTADYSYSTRGITADLTTGVVTTFKPLEDFNVSNTFNADGIVNRNNGVTDTTQDGIDKSNSNLITQSFAATTAGGIGLPDNGWFAANNFHPEIQLQYRNTDNGNNIRLIKTTTGSFDFQVQENTYSEVHIAALSTEGSSDIRLKFTYQDGTTALTNDVTVPDWFNEITETTSLYYLLNDMNRVNSTRTMDLVKDPALFGLQFVNPNALKTVTNISVEKTSGTGYLSFFGATGINNDRDQLTSIENIIGSSDNDSLSGDSGNNQLTGGAGNDKLYGQSGNDSLSGGIGDDELHGWLGADTLEGGNGNDTLYGQQDNDSLNGGDGNDLLYGEGNGSPTGIFSNDTLMGGGGNDTLYGGFGTDYLYGESGDDWVFGEFGNDSLDGGSGNDTLDGGDGDDDIVGWDDNDSLIGGLGNDTLNGMRGDDILNGEVGNDTLYGGDGKDQLNGGDGNDYLNGYMDDDILDGGAGDDILFGQQSNDVLRGGDGNDSLYGEDDGTQSQTYDGGRDNDSLDGGNGNDKIYGGVGNDTLDGGVGNDTLDGGVGNDTFKGGDGNDTADYSYSTRGITADLTTGVVTTFKPLEDFNVSNTFNADGIVNRNNGVTDTTQDGIDKSNSNLITQSFAAVVFAGGISLPDGLSVIDSYTNAGGIGLPDNGWFAANNFHPEIQLQYRNTDNGNNIRLIKTTTGSFDFQVQENTYSEVHIAALSTEGSSDIRLKFTYQDGTTALTNDVTVPDWFNEITETTSLYYLLNDMNRVNSTRTMDLVKDPALFGLQFVNPNALKTVTNISVEKTSGTGYLSFFGATGINNDRDQLTSIENIIGSSSSDILTGDASNNQLDGGAGDDILNGGVGNDTLYGNTGKDQLNGGDGNDYLNGYKDSDTLNGGNGDDLLFGQQDNDVLRGGDGNDTLYGEDDGTQSQTYDGSRDNDFLDGGNGNDKLYGGLGNDTLNGGDGNDTLDGGVGTDYLYGESGDDQVFGEVGNDTLNGGSGNDTLNGGDGDDDIAAWDDNDSLIGGLGNDTLNGMRGDDILYGGAGNDILYGGAGTDILYGGIGADSFRFDTQNEGIDTIKDFNRLEGDKILISRVTFGTGVTLEQFKFNDITKSLLFNNQQIAILENVTSSNFAVNQDITLI